MFGVQTSQQFYIKLSDICADIGQVCLATLVVPYIINNVKWWFAIEGISLSLVFWAISLIITKEINERPANVLSHYGNYRTDCGYYCCG